MEPTTAVNWSEVDYGQGVFHVVSYGRRREAERAAPAKAERQSGEGRSGLLAFLCCRPLCCPAGARP